MKLHSIAEKLQLKLVVGEMPESFEGVYTGDLLSRAMSRVDADNLWITIMNNINVIAVANLTDPAAVILAEGVELFDDARESAEVRGVTVLSCEKSAYEICAVIAEEAKLQ